MTALVARHPGNATIPRYFQRPTLPRWTNGNGLSQRYFSLYAACLLGFFPPPVSLFTVGPCTRFGSFFAHSFFFVTFFNVICLTFLLFTRTSVR